MSNEYEVWMKDLSPGDTDLLGSRVMRAVASLAMSAGYAFTYHRGSDGSVLLSFEGPFSTSLEIIQAATAKALEVGG